MSAEGEDKGHARRFNMNDARARAEQALRKSEFILSRAYGLFRDPREEWRQIKAEETTVPNIMVGYVAPLAAIPPICDLIGSTLFNSMLSLDPASAVVRGVVTWVVSIALVFLLGLLVNTLADNFDGDRDDLSAQKVAAYALTPAFLSGVFSLWPPLWWLSLIALAAMVFLMYRGLPILMKAPEDRALGYAATVTIAAMVAGIVLFTLASCVT
ncbi:MAG: YIP1 family protein [Hyphomonadaceae bacterium]|nr:YIP1 family protein [Hyphomonadaceae bacterium]